jgi:hypothetical protein
LSELVQSGLQVFHDFGGKDGWIGKVIGIFQAFITQPRDVKAKLVALLQVFVAEAVEAFRFFALEAVCRVVTSDKIIEVGALERVRL